MAAYLSIFVAVWVLSIFETGERGRALGGEAEVVVMWLVAFFFEWPFFLFYTSPLRCVICSIVGNFVLFWGRVM